jgi:hypothetical protein
VGTPRYRGRKYRDDRGGRLPTKTDLRSNYESLDTSTRHRLRTARQLSSVDMRKLAAVSVGALVLMALVIAGVFAFGEDFAYAAMMFAQPAIMVVGIVVCIRLIGKSGWQREVALLKQEQLCCACWYPIGDCRPDRDGCTVCPECASAWRMDDRPSGSAQPKPNNV